ncbi:hypothetical protein [Dysgonomonas massiliensis]|uniref:hypothetical protein n=1 Tax=Dysgonomonas massiliensis TaxID=2040292 RepID=UPI000C78DCD3|nr:hypothetical protein [Dysgonomonas massiliensis]
MGQVSALHEEQLLNIVSQAVQIGIVSQLVYQGDMDCTITQNKAYKTYGRGTIERWLAAKLITRYADYGKASSKTAYRYSVIELMKVAMSDNMIRDMSPKAKDEYKEVVTLDMQRKVG